MAMPEYTLLVQDPQFYGEITDRPGRGHRLYQKIIRTAAIACVCLGCTSVLSGLSCAVGGACPLAHGSSPQQMFATSTPTSFIVTNTKVGRSFVLRRPSALWASRQFDVQQRTTRDKAAQMAITGLLSIAAANHPAAASVEDDRIAQLMKAWNDEYGTEYGKWDMSGYRSDIKSAAVAAPKVEQAPEIVIPKKAPPPLDPIEQVMAEWNKEYGNQYGTWDMSGYRPSKREVAAPVAQPPAPVPKPVIVAPVVPAPAEVPQAPAPAPAPAAVVPVPPVAPVAPVAPVEKPAPAPAPKAAPAAVPEPEATSEEPTESGPAGLIIGGLVLAALGVAALPSGKEDSPITPSSSTPSPPPPPASAVPPSTTEGPSGSK